VEAVGEARRQELYENGVVLSWVLSEPKKLKTLAKPATLYVEPTGMIAIPKKTKSRG
jgi:hypothetical protein